MNLKTIAVTIVACIAVSASAIAQTSDSLIVTQMREEGIKFSQNTSVTLLMNGQEKFDDMFKAIKQARSSVHLE